MNNRQPSVKTRADVLPLPLVTFAVLCYNQEAYIDAAVASALEQDWGNLEIIFSDDHSSDATFVRIVTQCDAYAGSHSVIVTRNKATLGIGAHVNAIMAKARGEFVVIAAGDDISRPQRTTRLVKAWEASGRCTGSFYSGYDDMEIDGTIVGTHASRLAAPLPSAERLLFENIVVGATHAWSRGIFDIFGPLNQSVTHEDRNIAFRASLVDGVHYVPEALVARRRGGISDTDSQGQTRLRNARRYVCDASQSIADLEIARRAGLIDDAKHARLVSRAGQRLLLEALLLGIDNGTRFLTGVAIDLYGTAQRIGFAFYRWIRD